MSAVGLIFTAAATALNVTLYAATGSLVSLGCCEGCGHKSLDHLGSVGWGGSKGPRRGFCGFGGCECNLSRPQVEAMYPEPITVPTFAEADRGTGRWWK